MVCLRNTSVSTLRKGDDDDDGNNSFIALCNMYFERKIIRRIYSPVRQGRKWRIINNEERDNIIRKKDIVRFMKARRISWIGHVERMEDSRMPKRVTREKIYRRRKRGRPKARWLDDVQEDLREMGIEGWRRNAQDRDQWRRIAQEAKAHVGL
jgi:hypothetical protein